ncbi:acyl carrier protein [Tepiditoga spiralis]|uniref:Acyl carrier protein n=1 Tax=Tepiditoga spiralis TaxID=2108365 RepID=A0A7G1G9N3_9BACT|nr:acyl carrier protein [Tepiditoga spiralis]BBE30772.1 acyl carrier protein [Tepiditoga spiralis]
MTREELFDKMKEVIVETLGVEEEDVKLDSSFVDDLDADSLELVDLTMALESELGVTIEDDEIESLKSVEDALKIVANKLNIDED